MRPEDWPVRNGHAQSVILKPMNFFDRNPLINAPPVDVAAR